MSIRSKAELEKLRAAGKAVRRALDSMAAAIEPGVTTAELDRIGSEALAAEGAEAAPPKVYGFPAACCISVNDEAIHGIPGSRRLAAGDLVKLDLVAEKDGFFADAAVTVGVGGVSETATSLIRCAQESFRQGLAAARPGARVCEIGRAVEKEVRRRGFAVMRELCGHGIGRTIHEAPTVPNWYEPGARTRLTRGLVITIEPIISATPCRALLQRDRWTIRTSDGSLSAHYEHTIVVTDSDPILLTAA